MSVNDEVNRSWKLADGITKKFITSLGNHESKNDD